MPISCLSFPSSHSFLLVLCRVHFLYSPNKTLNAEFTADLQDAQSTSPDMTCLPTVFGTTTSLPSASGTPSHPGFLLAAFSLLAVSLLCPLSTLPIFGRWSCSGSVLCPLCSHPPPFPPSFPPLMFAVAPIWPLILNTHLPAQIPPASLAAKIKTELGVFPKQFFTLSPLSQLLLPKLWESSFLPFLTTHPH